MTAPKYKVHGVKDKHTIEYPATDDIRIVVAQAEKCGRTGFDAVVYVAQDYIKL